MGTNGVGETSKDKALALSVSFPFSLKLRPRRVSPASGFLQLRVCNKEDKRGWLNQKASPGPQLWLTGSLHVPSSSCLLGQVPRLLCFYLGGSNPWFTSQT